jgi:hypothetical protein
MIINVVLRTNIARLPLLNSGVAASSFSIYETFSAVGPQSISSVANHDF